MDSVKKINNSLKTAIKYIIANKEQYVKNPTSDFSRKRKLSMKDVIEQILTMGGGSLQKELYDFSKTKGFDFTTSAFVQQRSKILHAAFRDMFYHFNTNCEDSKTYHGYRVIGVDGTDVNCFRNPESENYLTTSQFPKGYNQVHLNAFYDISNKTFIDIEFQPRKKMDERKALIDMLERNTLKGKNIVITDRGYESYNVFAHFMNSNTLDFYAELNKVQEQW